MMFENFLRRFKTKKNLPYCSTFFCLGLAAKILFYPLNVVCSRLCGQQRVVRYTKYSMEVYAQQWNPPTLADYVANSLQSPSNGYSEQKNFVEIEQSTKEMINMPWCYKKYTFFYLFAMEKCPVRCRVHRPRNCSVIAKLLLWI